MEKKFRVRIKERFGKYHRRENNKRVVYRPGEIFEVTSHEYERLKNSVERLDLPHTEPAEEEKKVEQKRVEVKTEEVKTEKVVVGTKEVVVETESKEVEKNLDLIPVGDKWNVVNKATGKAVNDEPMTLLEARDLLSGDSD